MASQFLNEAGVATAIQDADGGIWVLQTDSSGSPVTCTVPSATTSAQGTAGLFLPLVVGAGLMLAGVL